MSNYGLNDNVDASNAGEEEDVYDPRVWLEERGMDYTPYFENNLEWDSKDEAIAWARARARPFKIILTKMNSNQRMLKLGCDQADKSRAETNAGNSKNCSCKFVFMGRRDNITGKWTLKLKHDIHNHDVNTSFLGHPFTTRMTNEEEGAIIKGSKWFMTPRALSKWMVEMNPENCTSTKQISNFKQKINLAGRGNLSVCQWTLRFLENENYIVRKKTPMQSNVLEVLMFIHPGSLHLMKLFLYLVVLDCTYSTNKYNMYLLEMVGMTCTNKTFNIGFAYLCNEDTPTYKWMLQQLSDIYRDYVRAMPTAIMTDRDQALINAIHQVFPEEQVQHLLCWVHIKSNIQAHAGGYLSKEEAEVFAKRCWTLFMSTTVASYEARLAMLLRNWHSRVEGMYAVLKELLASSVLGFNMMVQKIHHQLECQIRSVRTVMEMSRIKISNKLKTVHPQWRPLFKHLIHRISEKCFKLMLSMYDDVIANKYDNECDDHWWRDCNGVPCIHRIANAMLTGNAITLDEIHPFWQQVSWEAVAAKSQEIILVSIPHLKWNTMIEQQCRGELSDDALYQITSTYSDTQDPSQSRVIEPYNKEKGRPKGSTNFSKRRDNTYLEHVQERQSGTANQGGPTPAPKPPRPRKPQASSRGSPHPSPAAPSLPAASSSPVGGYSPYLGPSGTTRAGGSGTMAGVLHMGYNFGYRRIHVHVHPRR